MTCDKCKWWKRLFCLVACAEVNAHLNRVGDYLDGWRSSRDRELRKTDRRNVALSALLLIGLAIAYHVAAPDMRGAERANADNLRGACRHSGRVMVKGE